MGKGSSIGGSLGYQRMLNVLVEALTLAGGGGGAAGETFPDATVRGTGLYTIPVGFNGIGKVNVKAGETFSINGTVVLSSEGITRSWANMYNVRNIHNNDTYPYHLAITSATAGNFASYPIFATNTAYSDAYTNVSQFFKLLEGDIITGGRYHIELYAI